jgi:geranylgeranyl diphosphate synthase type II
MDNADVRRGQPTVHKKWDANTAILSGDSMLVLAYQRMQNCPADKLPAVLDCFTTTALEIGEGQQYDIEFETRSDVTVSEYLEMIRLKTSVLLACALKIGAMQGGASKTDCDLIYAFGEKIGLAFQLQDDYLDVYGDSKTFGKNIGGDILCNKKTYMLLSALNLANDEIKSQLQNWITMENPDPEEKISAVTSIYNELGIQELCKKEIRTYYNEAHDLLDRISIPEDKKKVLWDYVSSMIDRSF